MLVDHVARIHRVCFEPEPSDADLEALGSRERWLVYRDLVRTRLVGVAEAALPRTKAAVGADAFSSAIDEWLSLGGPATRYFRHVPIELSEAAIPRWEATEASWVGDLARYEIASWTVRHAPPDPSPTAEFSFDTHPVVGSAVRVLRLDHPVHETPTPETGYERKPVIICLHRNEQHRAIPQVLNPLAADLLEAWQRSDDSVADSVQKIAAAHDTAIGPAFIDKLSTLITTFIQQGIILGGRTAEDTL